MSAHPEQRGELDDKSPETLEADIAETRARISRSVDGLSYKLSPEGLGQQVKGTLGETQELTFEAIEGLGERLLGRSDGWGGYVTRFVKTNPVPTTLLGLGLTWLLMRSNGR